MRTQITCFLFLFFLASCLPNASKTFSQNTQYDMNYGTNFGFCIGPCHQELRIKGDTIDYYIEFTPERGGEKKEIKSFKEKLTTNEIELINNQFDKNKFLKLKTVYGCPDCADGGSEFLEVAHNNNFYRVTIEYQAEMPENDSLIQFFRSKMKAMRTKYLND